LMLGVPLTRLRKQTTTLELLDAKTSPTTVGALREELRDVSGVDVSQIENLADRRGYAVDKTWSGSGRDGRCDLLLRRLPVSPRYIRITSGLSRSIARPKPWSEYANSPARAALARRLVPELRSLLKQKLPAYMVPSTIQVLETLPLTLNGKV